MHGNADDAIIAIETELGTAPSGTFSTVKARLDSIGPVGAVLTSWTPTILQPGLVTGTTVHYARYQRTGRLVTGWFRLEAGGNGTINTPIFIDALPAAAAVANVTVGNFEFHDQSATQKYVGALYLETTTTFSFRVTQGSSENRLGAVGTAFTAAIASGDDLIGNFSYEAASD